MHIQDNQNYIALPKRNHRDVGQINCEKKSFLSNTFSIQIKAQTIFYQYVVLIPENIAKDYPQLTNNFIKQNKVSLRQKIGYIYSTGQFIFANKKVQIPTTYTFKIKQETIEVEIKYLDQLKVKDALLDEKKKYTVYHIYNSFLKETLKKQCYFYLGKNGIYGNKNDFNEKFKKNSKFKNNHDDLIFMRGIKVSAIYLCQKLKANLNLCTRVFHAKNLLEYIQQFKGRNRQINNQYVGKTVIARYGNYRTYKIEEIDFKMNPNSTFVQKSGSVITFKSYYFNYYGIQIHDTKQPLVKSISFITKNIQSNQQMKYINQYIYLIPQLLSLVHFNQNQRSDSQDMREIANYSNPPPQKQREQISKIISHLNTCDQYKIQQNMTKVDGYQLQKPIVKFKKNANLQAGTIVSKEELYQTHHFQNLVIVYSNYSKQDQKQAEDVFYYLKQASNTYKISYSQPFYCPIYPEQNEKVTAKDFCEQIKQFYFNGNKIQMILVLVKRFQQPFYNQIKSYLTFTQQIPNQFFRTVKLYKNSKLSILAKVAIQMCCKVGSIPWIIQNQLKYFNNKNFAYAAISTSKQSQQIISSFVGSTNNLCSKVYSAFKKSEYIKNRPIQKAILKSWIKNWILEYFERNKNCPQLLIIYRLDVAISQRKFVTKLQIEAVRQALQEIKLSYQISNYNPQIVYLFVTKNANLKFFSEDGGKLQNPQVGSVVTKQFSVNDAFDFHLIPNKSFKNARPTQHIVAYDSSTIPEQDLIRFTYEQCYNYFNWQGSVKIPACLQYSVKLSRFVGGVLGQKQVYRQKGSSKDKDKSYKNKFYYL